VSYCRKDFSKKRGCERGRVLFSQSSSLPHPDQLHLSPGTVLGQATLAHASSLREVEHGSIHEPLIDGGSSRSVSVASSSVSVVDTHALDIHRVSSVIFGASIPGDHTVIVWAIPTCQTPNGTASSPSTRDLGDDAEIETALKSGEELDDTEDDGDSSSESRPLSSTKTSRRVGSAAGVPGVVVVDGMVSVVR